MKSVNIYLNFAENTEEAFLFYKSVFKTEFSNFQRFKDIPGNTEIPEAAQNQVMHIALPIGGGMVLMASDAPDAMGFKVNQGNNFYINISLESKEETNYYFEALSLGGKVEMELQETFWGAYYGSFCDKYGIQWMVNFEEN